MLLANILRSWNSQEVYLVTSLPILQVCYIYDITGQIVSGRILCADDWSVIGILQTTHGHNTVVAGISQRR